MSAYEEGLIAAQKGRKTADNPYDAGKHSLEHVDWLLGFIDQNLAMLEDTGQ